MTLSTIGLVLTIGGIVPGAESCESFQCEAQILQMPSIAWRESLHGRGRPIGQQGAVSIWEAPLETVREMQESAKYVSSCPRVVARESKPGRIFVGQDVAFVSGVERLADGPPHETTKVGFRPLISKVEDGWSIEVAGRFVEQGVLARVSISDAQVLRLHSITMRDGVRGTPENGHGVRRFNAQCQVPEVASAEVKGEWLVPSGKILLFGMGPRTVPTPGGGSAIEERVYVLRATRIGEAVEPKLVRASGEVKPDRILTGYQGLSGPSPARVVLAMTAAPPIMRMAALAACIAAPVEEHPGTGFPEMFVIRDLDGAQVSEKIRFEFEPKSPAASPPPVPSRAIPQGFASNGVMVPLPPLPAHSTREPTPSARPQGTPQAHVSPPASAPVPSEPVPVGLAAGLAEQPHGVPVIETRIEARGDVRVQTRDGMTTIQAESVVITPIECTSCGTKVLAQEHPSLARVPEATRDRDVTAASTSSEKASEVERTMRIPVLGGAIEVRVKVGHAHEDRGGH